MKVLGINAFHGDSSACVFVDGQLVAAVEEERFNRIKHWAGFPAQAIRSCLEEGGLTLDDVDLIGVNRAPSAHILRKLWHLASRRPSPGMVLDRFRKGRKLFNLEREFQKSFEIRDGRLGGRLRRVEHHLAHLASAFLVSPFDRAAVLSVDAMGDFSSLATGIGEGSRIRVLRRVYFPHSLGIFYTAVTQFLGFPRYGDEYKVMGLAAYGEPRFRDAMSQILPLGKNGEFHLDLSYFRHHREKVEMIWEAGEPRPADLFSPRLVSLLGPPRRENEPLTDRHRDLARSAQDHYEAAFLDLLEAFRAETGAEDLCLAGGCAMNSLANGRAIPRSGFRNVFIQPAAGDAGGALGAAAWVQHGEGGLPRSFVMEHAYWGPSFSPARLEDAIRSDSRVEKGVASRELRLSRPAEDTLLDQVARAVADGRVVGWYQGRSEWGPRALGNRSILCDPRRADMKDILNLKIKRRESFRPFAPSILREAVGEWFEENSDVPFMGQVFPIRPDKRKLIPAVTHVDGTGRLQTVRAEENPLYHRLISAFARLTGVPLVLNTSFNENEPIVNRPEEALDCFLRTRMDLLVLGGILLERTT